MSNGLLLTHPSNLIKQRETTDNLLSDEQECYLFRLQQSHVVIAKDELGFYFFNGDDAVLAPVYYFDTEDCSENVQPTLFTPSFAEFIARRIRETYNV